MYGLVALFVVYRAFSLEAVVAVHSGQFSMAKTLPFSFFFGLPCVGT
jgi:hypothetical protein